MTWLPTVNHIFTSLQRHEADSYFRSALSVRNQLFRLKAEDPRTWGMCWEAASVTVTAGRDLVLSIPMPDEEVGSVVSPPLSR